MVSFHFVCEKKKVTRFIARGREGESSCPKSLHYHGNGSNKCAAAQQIYWVKKQIFLITHTERLSEDSEE